MIKNLSIDFDVPSHQAKVSLTEVFPLFIVLYLSCDRIERHFSVKLISYFPSTLLLFHEWHQVEPQLLQVNI